MSVFRRTNRESERLHQEELREEQEKRRQRFRILVCVNGTPPSYEGIKLAAEIGRKGPCDIILLYVRRVDQGLNTGGLQIRVARQNMLDWGLELPGIQYLRQGQQMLIDDGFMSSDWRSQFSHKDVFGDPLGDNKIEYRSGKRRRLILKLKIASSVAAGILDQYELGPYNLIITGPPKRWRGDSIKSLTEASTVQKVAMLAPCSVLTVRKPYEPGKGILICTDGSPHCTKSMQQAAVLAHNLGQPVTVTSTAPSETARSMVKSRLAAARATLKEMGIKDVKTLSRVGDPVQAIVADANRYAMTVVADSGKSRLKRFLVGSVAFDVMGQAESSVMNVR